MSDSIVTHEIVASVYRAVPGSTPVSDPEQIILVVLEAVAADPIFRRAVVKDVVAKATGDMKTVRIGCDYEGCYVYCTVEEIMDALLPTEAEA